MTTSLLIGCPVYQREWILPYWFANLDVALRVLDIQNLNLAWSFVVDPDDQATLQAIEDQELECVGIVAHPGPHSSERTWGERGRIEFMAELRNELLESARYLEPEYFLSIDSDILAHPLLLKNLFESIQQFDAVGGKAYMGMPDTGTAYPSFGVYNPSNVMVRPDHTAIAQVDVIMAVKLMNRVAYSVDYAYDEMGEDIAWSRSAKELGLSLGWDGRVASKHVMRPELLKTFDDRCGF